MQRPRKDASICTNKSCLRSTTHKSKENKEIGEEKNIQLADDQKQINSNQ